MSALWIQPEELGDYANTEFALEAAQTASYLLWAMSGRKFSGITTVTERYTCVLRRGRIGNSVRTTDALLFNGSVYDIPKSDFDFDEYSSLTVDGISPESRIKLRGGPVTEVHSIRNRLGEVLDPSYYYLVDHSTIQISVGAPWTPCNTEITYSYGAPPPTSGKMAARTLAIELAKLWNDEDCALPQRITSVSRQGVSYTILDSQDFIDDVRTGLYAIDLFLKTANPDRARAKAKVFSVDTPRARRYTPKALVYTANATSDITVNAGKTQTGSVTLGLSNINATFLTSQAGWTPALTVKSYSGMNSKDLSPASASVNVSASTITLSVGYTDANDVLGRVDPGSWDLYATHTNNSVVLITSGNLKINTII
jgi:hypothetical protein